jgi:hypothetical protein
MTLPDDVTRFVRRTFKDAEAKQALEALAAAVDHTGQPANDRLLRCAAVGSRGSLAGLLYLVDLLKRDYRDVIVAGEYEPSGGTLELRRIRNLTGPIPDN